MKLFTLLFTLLLSTTSFSFDQTHAKWDKLLKLHTKRVASGQVLVDYKSLSKNQKALNSYLKDLKSLSKKDFKGFSKDEKLAFWINSYNAFTFKLIVKNYSKKLKSIKDLGSLFTSPWSKDFVKLFGKKISLDDIEHGTIRKRFKEARIHFVVNCASIGCPSILPEAITGKQIEEQLERATVLFFKNNQKNRYNKKEKKIYLSKILDWYGKDFVKYHGSVKKFLKKYMQFDKNADIDFLKYDWKLNRY